MTSTEFEKNQGRFKDNPEAASQASKARWSKEKDTTSSKKALIADLGLSDLEETELVDSLADDWVKNQKISSLRELMKLSPTPPSKGFESPEVNKNEECPFCGLRKGSKFAADVMDYSIEMMQAELARRGVKKSAADKLDPIPDPIIELQKKPKPKLPELSAAERGHTVIEDPPIEKPKVKTAGEFVSGMFVESDNEKPEPNPWHGAGD